MGCEEDEVLALTETGRMAQRTLAGADMVVDCLALAEAGRPTLPVLGCLLGLTATGAAVGRFLDLTATGAAAGRSAVLAAARLGGMRGAWWEWRGAREVESL